MLPGSASRTPHTTPPLDDTPRRIDDNAPYTLKQPEIPFIKNANEPADTQYNPLQIQTTLQPSLPHRVIGEVLGGYIVIEQSDNLLLLDKHAAHERILYEQWHKAQPEVLSQQLLAPVVMQCDPTQFATLTQYHEQLKQTGFDIEDYGNGSLLLRAIPSDIDPMQATTMLDEMSSLLKSGHRYKTLSTRDEALKQIACKAAIKVGGSSQYAEISALVDAVLSDPDLRHCPHGRPVLVSLGRKDIEKLFLR